MSNFDDLMARLASPNGELRLDTEARFEQRSDPWRAFERWAVPRIAHADDRWTAQRILLQLGLDMPTNSPVGAAARSWLERESANWVITTKLGACTIPVEPGRILQQSQSPIRGAAWLDAEAVVTWSDNDVTVIDVESGTTRAAWSHADTVMGACALPNGRIASWGYDGMVQVHGADGSSAVIGRTEPILALWQLRDGGFIVGDVHGGLHRWTPGDATFAALPLYVDSDALWADSALVIIDDILLSFVSANVVIHHLPDCAIERRLQGHADTVRGLLEIGDHTVLSWSEDGTLRTWDIVHARQIAVFEGHEGHVVGAAASHSGILSWASDRTVRCWDRRGQLLATLAHASTPRFAEALGNGSIVTGDDDGITLWSSVEQSPRRHWPLVHPPFHAALSSQRLAVAAIDDARIHLIDVDADHMTSVGVHGGPVAGLTARTDVGQLLSWSTDGTVVALRGHDLDRGSDARIAGSVLQAEVRDDGRVLTAHALGTIKLCGPEAGLEHWSAREPGVEGMTVVDDAFVISWSRGRIVSRRLADGTVVARRDVEPIGPTVAGLGPSVLSYSNKHGCGRACMWRADTGALEAELPERKQAWQGTIRVGRHDALLWTQSGQLVRWAHHRRELRNVALAKHRVSGAVGSTHAVVLTGGPAFILDGEFVHEPVPIGDRLHGALALDATNFVCWSDDGDFLFASVVTGAIETSIRGRGQRPIFVTATGRGLTSCEADRRLRYITPSMVVTLDEVPLRANVAAVLDDESMLAIARWGRIDIHRLPSGEMISRWYDRGHLQVLGAGPSRSVIAATAAGSVIALAIAEPPIGSSATTTDSPG